MKQLVFVHGRAQEEKVAATLKEEWIEALEEGLEKNGLELPVPRERIRFPYYGDTLYQLSRQVPPGQAAEVIVRGAGADAEEQAFVRAVIAEVGQQAGLSEAQIAQAAGAEVIDRGPLNWEWLQAVLKAIDRHVPHGSGASIALATRDVYHYLKNDAIRHVIDTGVASAFDPGVETVVVAHSLGTVVAFNVLRHIGAAQGWKVPTLVTVGSPLAVTRIRDSLGKPIARPECVGRWINAMDERDVVALYPLTARHFPIHPQDFRIENLTHVRNKTSNRHGISGYLDDALVARAIHDALVA
ncbi:alpha/beta hydrolase [Pseudoxanthomonas broegbernensis]|uniref:Alpha/beta hydrolase n=1 Tax=Pseudoxanthomonas broegbernensis TaxID=83619 RepID=A0A7V8GKT5_9GAMM|nr:alpha/beta hydrolase [Pseudoxanthomonas broegbernensis]KAF1685258.1 alpha/beta hydrolase [Pseudoxanthomonas broegbernensis]MBB6066149.1 hypothetical protein [Pseudoxanthomonas broegbernensis]